MDYLMTPKEVADYLGVTLLTISRHINRKEFPLPCVRISTRTIRIRFSELEKWMKELNLTHSQFIKIVEQTKNDKKDKE